MNKRWIIPSLALNSTIFVLMIAGLISLFNSRLEANPFLYFTIDSNILMGVVSLVYVIFLILILKKKTYKIPKVLEMFKLAATTSVALTFLTVVLFLAPTMQDASVLFVSFNALYHVFIPIIAIITWLLFEHSHNKSIWPECGYGIIPMLIYLVFYVTVAMLGLKLGKAIKHYDWYGFLMFGVKAIPFTCFVMISFTFLISWALWFGNKSINIPYWSFSRSQYKRFWSMFCNAIIFMLVFGGAVKRFDITGSYSTLKFFTTQTNLFIGLMCLAYLIVEAKQFYQKDISRVANLLKLLFTTYIAITFVITVFALTPGAAIMKIKGYTPASLYTGANLWFHLIIPVSSIATWLVFEHTTNIRFRDIWYSFIYVGLYMIFYLTIAYTHVNGFGVIPMKYDWYKFCSFGVGLSVLFCFIIAGLTFLLTWLLRKFNMKINILKDINTKKVSVAKH